MLVGTIEWTDLKARGTENVKTDFKYVGFINIIN